MKKMKTKNLFVIASLVLLSICTSSAKEYNIKGGTKSFSQQYKVSSPLNLAVSTNAGNISVAIQDDNSVDVSFIVTLQNKILDITVDQLKEYADVEIINENSRLEINVKKTLVKDICIGFSIKAPANVSSTLKTNDGNINITGITGKQKINTYAGDISMEKIAGNIDVQVSGGNIRIGNSTANFVALTHGGNISLRDITGKLDVSTYGGNITGVNISNGLLAETKGGDITLSNAQGAIDATTAGGNIKLYEISGSVKAISHAGNISANIIKLTDKLELATSAGSINAIIPSKLGLNLDLSADNIDTPLLNFKGTAKKDRLIGQLNDGGIKVTISADAGDVVLNYK